MRYTRTPPTRIISNTGLIILLGCLRAVQLGLRERKRGPNDRIKSRRMNLKHSVYPSTFFFRHPGLCLLFLLTFFHLTIDNNEFFSLKNRNNIVFGPEMKRQM